MNVSRPFLAAIIPLTVVVATQALAQSTISLPRFSSIELHGGGEVIVRHGPSQQVTLVRGNNQLTDFTVDERGRLVIRACTGTCRGYNPRIEVVTPDIQAAAIHGGGSIKTEGEFPRPGSLALAVHGGGEIDAERIEARHVAASVSGGGSIRTRPIGALAGSIRGGGEITYCGNPASVASSVSGGGAIEGRCRR